MTRDDLERLDMASLRALARQHLAAREKSLRTRAALLAALLQKLVPGAAQPLGTEAQPPRGGWAPKPQRRRPTAPKSTPTAGRAGAMVGAPPTSPAKLPAVPEEVLAAPGPAPNPLVPAEEVLVEEGFFVFRAQQRKRTRRPLPKPKPAGRRRQAAPPPAPALQVGEEVPQLLARDPTTLFLFWDFRRDLERGAAFGLEAPRVLFRLYDGEVLVRTVEAPLGRRSLYLEGLLPGHTYSVEAWLAGRDGHARPTGRRSAPLRLAPDVPSSELEVQMVRVPWEQPLAGPLAAGAAGAGAGKASVAGPARVALPASLEWRGGPGPSGPRSGRP